jgi:hypothetical protein
MADLIYIDSVPKDERGIFAAKVLQVAGALQIDPSWLMQVMKAESGLNPAIENTKFPFADGYATGLIQFIPSTARELGTTVSNLKLMSRVAQMDYVLKYFKPWAGKIHSYFDLYLVTFFPEAVGKPDSYVFESKRISALSIAKSNPSIDINKDQRITMAEFRQYLKNTVPVSLRDKVFGAAGSFGLLLLAFALFLLFFKR